MESGFPNISAKRIERTVTSADGTRIFYVSYGEGEKTLVLSPGLATPPIVYDYIIERFSPYMRVITWDMRGTFRSENPGRGVEAHRIADHVADLDAIVAAEKLDRFALGGWSMGVQVSLEYCHRNPDRCDGLILIAGSYGNVLQTLSHPIVTRGIVAGLRLLIKLGRPINALTHFVLYREAFLKLIFTASIVTANKPFVLEVIRQFRSMDFERYMGWLLVLNEHSAESYLEEIEAPTVVIGGDRDIMTPVWTSKLMAERIPNADLLVVPNGTHYTPLEYPEIVNLAIERLLRGVYPEALPARVG